MEIYRHSGYFSYWVQSTSSAAQSAQTAGFRHSLSYSTANRSVEVFSFRLPVTGLTIQLRMILFR